MGTMCRTAGGTRGATLVAERDVAAEEAPGLPTYEWEDILRHDRAGDFWIVFHDGVYDVSEWMYRHPGGAEILIEAWGQDVSELFTSIGHTDEAWLLTQSFKVGVLKQGSLPPL